MVNYGPGDRRRTTSCNSSQLPPILYFL